MKTSLVVGSSLAFVLASLTTSSVAEAAVHKLKATMTAQQELPLNSVPAGATGTATLSFDDVTKKLTGTVTFKDLHTGQPPPGTLTQNAMNVRLQKGGLMTQGGPLIVSFTNNNNFPSPLAVDVTVNNAGDITALLSGQTYVNVASNTYQGGECRGQVVADTGADAGADAATDASDAGSSGSSGTSGSSGASGTSGSSGTSGEPDPGPGTSNGGITTPGDPPAEEKSDDACEKVRTV